MTLEDGIHALRLRVFAEAERTGNVSATCRRYGWSRARFYELRERFQEYGADGLWPKPQKRPGRPSGLSVEDERRILALAVAWPTRGPQYYSDELARDGHRVPHSTVWRFLRRQGLNHRSARLLVLEQASAARGLLTERTAPRSTGRHLVAERPGDLLSLVVERGPQIGFASDGFERMVAWKRDGEERLRELRDQVQATGIRCRCRLELGKPSREILRVAEEERVALIAMGSHAHGSMRRLLRRSVTGAVVDGASCPVLVVPFAAGKRLETEDAVPAARLLRRVLLATDVSDAA